MRLRIRDHNLIQGKKWRRPLTALNWLLLFALGLALAVVMLLRDDTSKQLADIDPLAYQAYLEGRMLRRTTNGLAQAITALERALELDPGLPLVFAVASAVAAVDWNWTRAEALLQKGLSIPLTENRVTDPALQGDPDAALREMDLEPHPDCQLYGLVIAHTTAGNEPVANGTLEQLKSRGAERWAYRIGALHAYRGEADKAFGSFDLAYALRDSGLIKTDPAGTGDSSLEVVLFPYDPKKKFSPIGNSTLLFGLRHRATRELKNDHPFQSPVLISTCRNKKAG